MLMLFKLTNNQVDIDFGNSLSRRVPRYNTREPPAFITKAARTEHGSHTDPLNRILLTYNRSFRDVCLNNNRNNFKVLIISKLGALQH